MDSKGRGILDIIGAGLEGDIRKVELAALTLGKRLRKDDPEISEAISECITSFSLRNSGTLRNSSKPVPVDPDSQLEMAMILPPKHEPEKPILNQDNENQVLRFLEERSNMTALLSKNIRPSNSLLLIGLPGTGKTMIAKYIASSIKKDLVVLDLSSSISSLLGKTGSNLKKVLTYARNTGSVLLLDEFDAIAKRRDDNTDLGEIKRVVNVLLMELENWPVSSILLATSNHPELLDKAVWRRFDHVLQIAVPGERQRTDILKSELDEFYTKDEDGKVILQLANEILEGRSAADICKYCMNVKRRMVIRSEDFKHAAFPELALLVKDTKSSAKICIAAREKFGSSKSIRELADMLGMSPSGIQHHVSKLRDELPKSEKRLPAKKNSHPTSKN